jgi:RNA polymerase sigma factor (sigma-70 family)
MAAVPSSGPAAAPFPAEAARELYERYGPQILAFCHHRLGNREEAEDATQSTFLNALRGLQRGVSPELESAWLYKIAHNVCLTRQRSSWRRRRVETPGDLDAIHDFLPAREPEADELIGLPDALAEMPEQQRRALLLREWQGLSYREIANELGLSQAAVETLLFRARRSLARGLAEEQPARGRRRLSAGGNMGSAVAVLKTLLVGGGAKIAATVATVAATSIVAATPAARHDLAKLVAADPRPQPAHVKPVVKAKPVRKVAAVPVHVVVAPHPAVVATPRPVIVAPEARKVHVRIEHALRVRRHAVRHHHVPVAVQPRRVAKPEHVNHASPVPPQQKPAPAIAETAPVTTVASAPSEPQKQAPKREHESKPFTTTPGARGETTPPSELTADPKPTHDAKPKHEAEATDVPPAAQPTSPPSDTAPARESPKYDRGSKANVDPTTAATASPVNPAPASTDSQTADAQLAANAHPHDAPGQPGAPTQPDALTQSNASTQPDASAVEAAPAAPTPDPAQQQDEQGKHGH